MSQIADFKLPIATTIGGLSVNLNHLKINQDLLFENWSTLVSLDVNECYNYLLDKIMKSIDRHAKEKFIKISKKNVFVKPWVTVPLLKMRNKCKKLFKKSIGKSRDTLEYVRYLNYRKSLVSIKRHDKYNFYKKLFEKIGNNSRNLWSVLNGLIGKSRNKHTITSILDRDNLLTDSKSIANCFNNHFVSAGKKVQEGITKVNAKHTDYLDYKYKSLLLFSPVTEGALTKLVDDLVAKTSHGFDCISNELLKRIFYSIRAPLCIVINKSLNDGAFPDNMKTARILPLFKSSDHLLCDNFRPISLLSVISKLLEKIVYKQLTSHMESNNQVFTKQFGFRKNHSCVDAIETFIGNIIECFDKDMSCLSIFIDLRKAFDTVNHSIIFDKLQAIGVNNVELQWFRSYMEERYQYVDINGSHSDLKLIETGVAQGSLLGVLLFQLIINDLHRVLKFCSSILYADDTTIYVIGKNCLFLEKKLQSDLNRVSMWLKANSLSLNITKTKFMHFTRNIYT